MHKIAYWIVSLVVKYFILSNYIIFIANYAYKKLCNYVYYLKNSLINDNLSIVYQKTLFLPTIQISIILFRYVNYIHSCSFIKILQIAQHYFMSVRSFNINKTMSNERKIIAKSLELNVEIFFRYIRISFSTLRTFWNTLCYPCAREIIFHILWITLYI